MTHPEPDDGPTLLLMACRPTDPNSFPEGPARDNLAMLAPLDPGSAEMECEKCGMGITIGPRQRSQYEADPSSFLLVDFICAVRIASQLGDGTQVIPMYSLGGK